MNNQLIEIRIQECIKQIAETANQYPGVTIIHDIRNWSVLWMSPNGLKQLGITADEIKQLSVEEYHARHFNPEDAKDYSPRILSLMQADSVEDSVTYFQQVRINEYADWTWHMSSTKILLRDENMSPVLCITMSFAIDAMHHMASKASRLLEENNFLRKNYEQYAKLSQRERDVLRTLAIGKSAAETAEELFISVNTVETHRKNIRQKLSATSFFELSQYARAFDLI
ncbi:response regulator transcription factor [Mucilaginibacter terrae]|uniref:DNA-binding CsgD family transcriptional regulator n=1 Tax=Mucilaginibacter terrae TaxID=1955052 RepID=A0ABU3GP24_9SPHI|nr:helix-turn-helix transcriptional regulator [Mucilaginibacter terrae]MDT3401538.1 DNA-binding CsgD family transcriptional regulator [Mucilaginibacter terrae]